CARSVRGATRGSAFPGADARRALWAPQPAVAARAAAISSAVPALFVLRGADSIVLRRGGNRLQVHLQPQELHVVLSTGGFNPLQPFRLKDSRVEDDAVELVTAD